MDAKQKAAIRKLTNAIVNHDPADPAPADEQIAILREVGYTDRQIVSSVTKCAWLGVPVPPEKEQRQ